MNFNDYGNLWGRALALVLLIGTVAGIRCLARGGDCPLGGRGCCAVHSGMSATSSKVEDLSR